MWQRYNGTTKIFEKSTDNGANWSALGLDAAIITQGSFPIDLSVSKTRPVLALTATGTTAKARFTHYGTNYITYNVSFDGTNWNLDDTGAAGGIIGISGSGFAVYHLTAGTNPRTPTTTLVMTSGGVMSVNGFGTHTFAASGTGHNILKVDNTTSGAANGAYLEARAGTTIGQFIAYSQGYTTSGLSRQSGVLVYSDSAGGLTIGAGHVSGNIYFHTGGTTERARFLTTGRFLLGTVNAIGSGWLCIETDQNSYWGIGIKPTSDVAGGYFAVFCNAAGTAQGGISATNSTTTAFNTTSDQRLKRDLGIARSTDVLVNTIVHDFEWLSDGGRARGVFAQEAINVHPAAVTAGQDDRPWMVDYSKYVPDLIIGWQNHERHIEALEWCARDQERRIAELERRLS